VAFNGVWLCLLRVSIELFITIIIVAIQIYNNAVVGIS